MYKITAWVEYTQSFCCPWRLHICLLSPSRLTWLDRFWFLLNEHLKAPPYELITWPGKLHFKCEIFSDRFEKNKQKQKNPHQFECFKCIYLFIYFLPVSWIRRLRGMGCVAGLELLNTCQIIYMQVMFIVQSKNPIHLLWYRREFQITRIVRQGLSCYKEHIYFCDFLADLWLLSSGGQTWWWRCMM